MYMQVAYKLCVTALLTPFLHQYFFSKPDGIEYSDKKLQDFVRRISVDHRIDKPVFLREVDSPFNGKKMAGSAETYDRYEIFIPQNAPFVEAELYFVVAHELGHIANYHPKMFNLLIFLNLSSSLLLNSSIPSSLMNVFATLILILSIYRLLEYQADQFAFTQAPIEMLEKAFEAEKDKNVHGNGWMNFFLPSSQARITQLNTALTERKQIFPN